SSDLQPEGTYYVGVNPHNYHPGAASFGDHTTGNGLMLIVNGATTPNIAVWQETVTVFPHTDYQFSLWAASWGDANGLHPSSARLRLQINGVPVGENFLLSAQDGQWNQFIVTWNAGDSTQAILQVIDSNPDPGGNDFCVDDIAFTSLGASVS